MSILGFCFHPTKSLNFEGLDNAKQDENMKSKNKILTSALISWLAGKYFLKIRFEIKK